MNNQLQNKANRVAELLAQYGLNKEAKQTITHRSLLSQDNLGREMTNEIHANEDGIQADTEAAENKPSDKIDAIPNAQNLNTSAQSALAETGSTVETQESDGSNASMPADQAKNAAFFAQVLKRIQDKKAAADGQQQAAPQDAKTAQFAQVLKKIQDKKASAQKPADDGFITATEVLAKWASLGPRSTKEDIDAAQASLEKLASVNPAFTATRDNLIKMKKAAEVDELAAEAGIAPEDAAEALDAAVAANPEMEAELADEATGEAVNDLANAEQEVGELVDGAQMLADGASQVLGEEVTADDIADALDTVTQMADEMGVDPIELIQAAAEEIQQGEEPTEEDQANAKELVAYAEELGMTPDELIQELAASVDADEAGGEEVAGAEEPIEKAASLQKQSSPRVAYVLEQLKKA